MGGCESGGVIMRVQEEDTSVWRVRCKGGGLG